jgi:hypothetical protein
MSFYAAEDRTPMVVPMGGPLGIHSPPPGIRHRQPRARGLSNVMHVITMSYGDGDGSALPLGCGTGVWAISVWVKDLEEIG